MLQGNRLEPAAVQVLGRPHIIVRAIVGNLQPNRRRIIVDLAVIGHRDDDSFEVCPRSLDGALQIGGEGRDAAAAGQRVSDERDTIYDGQFDASGCSSAARPGEVGTSAASKDAYRTRSPALRSVRASGFMVG